MKSTKQNLRNLSIVVSAGKVASLVGPVGSGKSALVHYLANITGLLQTLNVYYCSIVLCSVIYMYIVSVKLQQGV